MSDSGGSGLHGRGLHRPPLTPPSSSGPHRSGAAGPQHSSTSDTSPTPSQLLLHHLRRDRDAPGAGQRAAGDAVDVRGSVGESSHSSLPYPTSHHSGPVVVDTAPHSSSSNSLRSATIKTPALIPMDYNAAGGTFTGILDSPSPSVPPYAEHHLLRFSPMSKTMDISSILPGASLSNRDGGSLLRGLRSSTFPTPMQQRAAVDHGLRAYEGEEEEEADDPLQHHRKELFRSGSYGRRRTSPAQPSTGSPARFSEPPSILGMTRDAPRPGAHSPPPPPAPPPVSASHTENKSSTGTTPVQQRTANSAHHRRQTLGQARRHGSPSGPDRAAFRLSATAPPFRLPTTASAMASFSPLSSAEGRIAKGSLRRGEVALGAGQVGPRTAGGGSTLGGWSRSVLGATEEARASPCRLGGSAAPLQVVGGPYPRPRGSTRSGWLHEIHSGPATGAGVGVGVGVRPGPVDVAKDRAYAEVANRTRALLGEFSATMAGRQPLTGAAAAVRGSSSSSREVLPPPPPLPLPPAPRSLYGPLPPVDEAAGARQAFYTSRLGALSRREQDLAATRSFYLSLLKGGGGGGGGGGMRQHAGEVSPLSRTASPATLLTDTADVSQEISRELRNRSTTAFYLDPDNLKLPNTTSQVLTPSNTATTPTNTVNTPPSVHFTHGPAGLGLRERSADDCLAAATPDGPEARRMAELLSTVRALRRQTGDMASQLTTAFESWRSNALLLHAAPTPTKSNRSRRHHKKRWGSAPSVVRLGCPVRVPTTRELFGDLFPERVRAQTASVPWRAAASPSPAPHAVPLPLPGPAFPIASPRDVWAPQQLATDTAWLTDPGSTPGRSSAGATGTAAPSCSSVPSAGSGGSVPVHPPPSQAPAAPTPSPLSTAAVGAGEASPAVGPTDAPSTSMQLELFACRQALQRQAELSALHLAQVEAARVAQSAAPGTRECSPTGAAVERTVRDLHGALLQAHELVAALRAETNRYTPSRHHRRMRPYDSAVRAVSPDELKESVPLSLSPTSSTTMASSSPSARDERPSQRRRRPQTVCTSRHRHRREAVAAGSAARSTSREVAPAPRTAAPPLRRRRSLLGGAVPPRLQTERLSQVFDVEEEQPEVRHTESEAEAEAAPPVPQSVRIPRSDAATSPVKDSAPHRAEKASTPRSDAGTNTPRNFSYGPEEMEMEAAEAAVCGARRYGRATSDSASRRPGPTSTPASMDSDAAPSRSLERRSGTLLTAVPRGWRGRDALSASPEVFATPPLQSGSRRATPRHGGESSGSSGSSDDETLEEMAEMFIEWVAALQRDCRCRVSASERDVNRQHKKRREKKKKKKKKKQKRREEERHRHRHRHHRREDGDKISSYSYTETSTSHRPRHRHRHRHGHGHGRRSKKMGCHSSAGHGHTRGPDTLAQAPQPPSSSSNSNSRSAPTAAAPTHLTCTPTPRSPPPQEDASSPSAPARRRRRSGSPGDREATQSAAAPPLPPPPLPPPPLPALTAPLVPPARPTGAHRDEAAAAPSRCPSMGSSRDSASVVPEAVERTQLPCSSASEKSPSSEEKPSGSDEPSLPRATSVDAASTKSTVALGQPTSVATRYPPPTIPVTGMHVLRQGSGALLPEGSGEMPGAEETAPLPFVSEVSVESVPARAAPPSLLPSLPLLAAPPSSAVQRPALALHNPPLVVAPPPPPPPPAAPAAPEGGGAAPGQPALPAVISTYAAAADSSSESSTHMTYTYLYTSSSTSTDNQRHRHRVRRKRDVQPQKPKPQTTGSSTSGAASRSGGSRTAQKTGENGRGGAEGEPQRAAEGAQKRVGKAPAAAQAAPVAPHSPNVEGEVRGLALSTPSATSTPTRSILRKISPVLSRTPPGRGVVRFGKKAPPAPGGAPSRPKGKGRPIVALHAMEVRAGSKPKKGFFGLGKSNVKPESTTSRPSSPGSKGVPCGRTPPPSSPSRPESSTGSRLLSPTRDDGSSLPASSRPSSPQASSRPSSRQAGSRQAGSPAADEAASKKLGQQKKRERQQRAAASGTVGQFFRRFSRKLRCAADVDATAPPPPPSHPSIASRGGSATSRRTPPPARGGRLSNSPSTPPRAAGGSRFATPDQSMQTSFSVGSRTPERSLVKTPSRYTPRGRGA